MKTRKWIILLLCFGVLLTGCGKKQSQTENEMEPTRQQMTLVAEPTQEPAEETTEPSTPVATEKPKENETSWEDDDTSSTTAHTEGPKETTEPTAAPTESPVETTEPTAASTEPTDPPQTEPEDENAPQPNTEPGWGALQ